ncbi:MAG: amylo-alpha-1,6-glucosidase, partial [Tepidisphaerales bacterium]
GSVVASPAPPGSAVAGAGGGGLAAGESRDTRCRPNQIFAVSLPHSPLTAEQQRAVVEVVRRELLTPYGLRTLSPSERQYRPTYGGPPAVRDASYHNGTVWPWLMGPFLDAYLRVSGDTREAREEARRMLRPLLSTLETGCIGQIAEIFEGQPPHREVGAPAQAWSVAEVLRLARRLGV